MNFLAYLLSTGYNYCLLLIDYNIYDIETGNFQNFQLIFS